MGVYALVVSAGTMMMRGTGRLRFVMTGRHWRSRSRRTTTAAAMVRRSVYAVLLKPHENKRHAVCSIPAAAHTPCLRSRRRADTACYRYSVLSLGGQGQDNGVSPRHLARGNKLAVSVSDSYVKIILRHHTWRKIVFYRYRKSALAGCCTCRRTAGAVICI